MCCLNTSSMNSTLNNYIHDSSCLASVHSLDHLVSAVSWLPSTLSLITDFLQGGLPFGALVEWGSPMGSEGRRILLTFLVNAMQLSCLCLWNNGHCDVTIFPPAWSACGIDLNQLIFTNANHPLTELKPVFLSSLFKVIVLDTALGQLSNDECAWLRHQASLHHYLVIIVRNYRLSNKLGNAWVKLRLNALKHPNSDNYQLWLVKGGTEKRLNIPARMVV